MDTRFIEELASAAPTPGGGGASAYVGALSSALASMVGNLTVGKKRYADVEEQTKEALSDLEALRTELLALIAEDARAFEPLAATYGMPRTTAEEQRARDKAQQAALIDAIEVPLAIMKRIAEVVSLISFMAENGSRLALSDAGVAAAFARAASDGASLNIYINLKSLADAEKRSAYRAETDALLEATRKRCDELFEQVRRDVS